MKGTLAVVQAALGVLTGSKAVVNSSSPSPSDSLHIFIEQVFQLFALCWAGW